MNVIVVTVVFIYVITGCFCDVGEIPSKNVSDSIPSVSESGELSEEQLDASAPIITGGSETEAIIYEAGKIIRCSAVGYPKPNITWNCNERPVPQYFEMEYDLLNDENETLSWVELKLPGVNKAIYGPFTCKAENSKGNSKKTYMIEPSENSSFFMKSVRTGGSLLLLVILVAACRGWKHIHRRSRKYMGLPQEDIELIEVFRCGIRPHEQIVPEDRNLNVQIKYLPYNSEFEIPKDDFRIEFNNLLEEGDYGVVFAGKQKIPPRLDWINVAVKTTKRKHNITVFEGLLLELKILANISEAHVNVVNLIGASTINIESQREAFLFVDRCENGTLQHFLQLSGNRRKFVDLFNIPKTVHPVQNGDGFHLEDLIEEQSSIKDDNECNGTWNFSTRELLRWAAQISEGMMFLQSKQVIHGNLAARNIYLTSNLVAKIGNLGFKKHTVTATNSSESLYPSQWLALECLQGLQVSYESDVWAYGVTLWELFTIGELPFSDISTLKELLDFLNSGNILSRPKHSTTEIYEIMNSCWNWDNSQRPKFQTLTLNFRQILNTVAFST